MAENFVVLIADVRGSRNMTQDARYEGQLFLKSALVQINEKFGQRIEAPFMITKGDEIQGVTKQLGDAIEIILDMEQILHPLKLRYAIGTGEIHKMGSLIPIEMDGPAFHRANEALELCKKNKCDIFVNTENIKDNMLLNHYFNLIFFIKNRWNEKNFERYWDYKELGTFDKVAKKENVSPQAIWDSMKNKGMLDVIGAEEFLMQYFK